jgi:hypothetical protein
MVNGEHPPLRTAVSSDAKLFSFLRAIAPFGIFAAGLRSRFKLDKADGRG